MKSVSVAAAAALLAGMSIAQPHGHHHHAHHAKRELVTEWDTVWETVTVVVDDLSTQTLLPTADSAPAQVTSSSSPVQAVPTSTEPSSTSVQATSSVQSSSSEASILEASLPTTSSIITSTSTPSSTFIPIPTTTSIPVVVPSSTSTPEEVQPPATSASISKPVLSVAAADGYVYAGADAFGTSSMDSEKYNGDITFYTMGIGACGYDDTGKDLTANLVAISESDWMARNPGTSLGLNEPNHPWCDQTITISANGKTTTALVHDNCPGCSHGSIDVSEAVFEALFGGLGVGRSTANWSFN
ncbi:hypothetical protein GGR50DRAFT_88362 [Xylaria sp. CBS 124048]|nr:hypothetical protein GGR50DRAFT_88362 [Xylaria sp. CBS 124048]